MSDRDDVDFDDAADQEFDAIARSAGRAVREPAPADGLRRVQAAKRRRTVAQAGTGLAAAALVIAGIAAISSRDDSPSVAVEPVETTTTSPTGSVPQDAVTTPDDADSSAEATATGNAETDPATTTTVADTAETDPATTTTAAAPETVEYVSAGFYAGPEWVGDRTAAITDPLADGLYFADEYSSDGTTLNLRLVQRIRGQACIDEFGDGAADECASDSGQLNDPSTVVTTTADGIATSIIFLGGVGAGSGYEAFRVPASEFLRLAAGEPPSAGAPEGYGWVPFGVFVEVSGGRIVSVDQQFSS